MRDGDHAHRPRGVDRPAPIGRPAFTIVELVVVVGILALLVGLLAPTLGGVRAASRDAETAFQVRRITIASITFADQRDGLLPAAGSYASTAHASWFFALEPFLDASMDDLARCPDDHSPHWTEADPATGLERRSSYGVNFYLSGSLPGFRGAGRLASLRAASSTVYVSELAETGAYATSDHFHPELWLIDTEGAPAEQLALDRRPDAAVHWGHLDGHVERAAVPVVYALDPDSSIGDLRWFANRFDPTVAR